MPPSNHARAVSPVSVYLALGLRFVPVTLYFRDHGKDKGEDVPTARGEHPSGDL